MLRFTTSRMMGLAIALTLGTVATASAQQDTTRTAPRRSRSQLPVRKEQPSTTSTPAAPTETSTATSSAPMRRDTVLVGRSDTTIVMCNCATTQAASAGEVLPLIPARIQRWFGNGLYLGLGSGSMLPVGDMMNAYNPGGWGVNVPIGWDPPKSPLGVRVNLGYAKFESASPAAVVNDAKELSAALDAKFRVPFGRFLKATSGAYIVGGGAVHHFTNYNQSIYRSNNFVNQRFSTPANDAAVIANSSNVSSGQTNLGIHGGLGLSLGVGPAELFVESRYTRVYTPGRAINYVPVVAGLTFH